MGLGKLLSPVTPSVALLLKGTPNEVAGKLLSGIRLTGESGDDDGDGSDSGDESVVESVVVGEESADSDICVDALSWCLWFGSQGRLPPRRGSCGEFMSAGGLEPISANL